MRRIILILLFVLTLSQAVFAQDTSQTCPVAVENALDIASDSCRILQRNTACYAHPSLEATPVSGVEAFTFVEMGDKVSTNDIRSLSLGGYDEITQTWGIALLSVQANLPNTLPGQAVMLVIFGDVMLTSATGATIEVTTTARSNVRQQSSPTAAIVGSLDAGSVVVADGRNSESTWVHIRLNEQSTGWVFAELVNSQESLDTLEIVTTETSTANLHAFHFQSGVGVRACDEVPPSGILIQTQNKHAGLVRLVINNVVVELGSTAFLTAQPDGEMTFYLIEGHAQVSVQDISQVVPAGTQVSIPLVDLSASGPPSQPVPYDAGDVISLPLTLLRGPVDIEAAAPLALDTIAQAITNTQTTLENIASPCIAAPSGEVNLRRGPATWYESGSKFSPGETKIVSGQLLDESGYTWYQLEYDVRQWVRGDLVRLDGLCETVPVISEAPSPEVARHPWYYSIHDCGITLGRGSGVVVRPFATGETLQLMYGAPIYPFAESSAAARAAVGNAQPVLSVDGRALALEFVRLAVEPDHFNYTLSVGWLTTPGIHTLSAVWGNFSGSCTIEVLGQ